jgi:metal-dependent amidase/aminoacylase/carboxypeptidase family protein
MSAATDALNALVASMQNLQTLVPDSMPALVAAVRTETERTITAGTTAYGQRCHAAKALTVMSVNKTIYITLTGPEARHHIGRVKGGRKRAIIPERGLPSAMANAMRAVLQRAFDEAVQP